jgi:hypothetical protein
MSLTPDHLDEVDEVDDLCCEHAEEVVCECEAADDERCHVCGGSGWYVPDHCCVCGGSPYCLCCRTCATCIGDCSCPITVQLDDGRELVP